MSIQSNTSTKVQVFKSATGDEQSVVYTAPNGTTCTLRVSAGNKLSATVNLRDYTCENDDDDDDGDGEETSVDVRVKAETTESGLKKMGPHKVKNTGSALEVVEDKAAGQFVIVYGVPPERMGAMFVSPVKELDMLIVAHIYGTSEQSFSVVAKISCDGAKGLTYHMTEPTQHTSTEEALQAIRDILERREDIVNQTCQKDYKDAVKCNYEHSSWCEDYQSADRLTALYRPRDTFDSLNTEGYSDQRMKATSGRSARPQPNNRGRINNRDGRNRGDFNNSIVNINIFTDAVKRNLRPTTRRSLPPVFAQTFEVGLPWRSRPTIRGPFQPMFTPYFGSKFLPSEYDSQSDSEYGSFFSAPKFRWFW